MVCALRLPRCTLLSRVLATRCRAVASLSASSSSSFTASPALARLKAMPTPMVPPPITATELIGRVSTAVSRPLILPAWRSAKNLCTSARRCGDCKHS
ncbi:hypothetical protein D3C85_1020140 [compost metagenome]